MELIVSVIKNVSLVGSSPTIFIVALLMTLYFLFRKDWIRVVLVFLSMCSGLCSVLLKGLFEQSRPEGYVSTGFIPWERIFVWESYSFPSTHTVVYTAFFGYLFYLSLKLKGVDKIIRHITRLFCAFMVVFVGVSRILLGAHFTKDVVTGYLIGFLYLGGIIVLERFLEQRQAKKLLKHRWLWSAHSPPTSP